MEEYKPKFIGFTSKTAASHALGYKGVTNIIDYGLQEGLIGQSKIFVLPSTSGNAKSHWDDIYWFELKRLIQ